MRQQTPFIVCLMGVDGAGKSTVAAVVAKQLQAHQIPIVLLHTHDYGSAAARGVVRVWASEKLIRRFRYVFLLCSYLVILDHRLSFKRRFKRHTGDTVLLTDRYFYDKYVRFSVWGIAAPGLLALYKRWVPRPACSIFLDIPPAVAVARKGEYSLADYERFRSAYLKFVRSMGTDFAVVDATQPLTCVTARVEALVLQALKKGCD